MKIRFENLGHGLHFIQIDGVNVGKLQNCGGWDGCYIHAGTNVCDEIFIARFKKLGGPLGAAKRWVKAALLKAGSMAALVEALADPDMTPDDYQPEPLPRRSAKTRRDEVRLAEWAKRKAVGHQCHFITGRNYVNESSKNGKLVDVASEGYLVEVADGTVVILAHDFVQAVFPNE